MSIGLVALLDDVAALAKVAAASLDDVATHAAKASMKAAGVVIDDAAVTPRYVVGFAADRELPIVAKIALGSLRNKLLFLLPGALALSYFLPVLILPLLMLGAAYLCYEGAEKVYEIVLPHKAHSHEAALLAAPVDPKVVEDQKVSGAIRTDFILSAEIMAITLASVPAEGKTMQAIVLAIVGVAITAAVYGVVALIVKADDVGVRLARQDNGSAVGAFGRFVGRALVKGMPVFLSILSAVGTAAMIWVGGGIIAHGLEEYGFPAVAHAIHAVSEGTGEVFPWLKAVTQWAGGALGSFVFGLLIGAALIPIVGFFFAPLRSLISRVLPGKHTKRVAGVYFLAL